MKDQNPAYSDMYSKLEFDIDTDNIVFSSHELVYIANNLVKNAKSQNVKIPSKELIDQYMEGCVTLTDDILNKSTSEFPWLSVIIPFFTSQPTCIEQWLYLANELSQQYNKDPRCGWWNIIGNRLLLIRTDETNGRHLFYVSDHGFTDDIIADVSETACDIKWFSLPYEDDDRFYDVLDQLSQQMQNMNSEEFERYKKEITDNIKDDNELFTDEFKKELVADLNNPEMQNYYFKHAVTSIPYIVNILRKKLKGLEEKYDDFYEAFMEIGGGNDENTRKLIVFYVLREIMIEVNNGLHMPLFRPVYSFGISEPGVSYRVFAEKIIHVLQINNDLTSSDIAKKMREILMGKPLIPIQDDHLSFLSAIVGSWFISESARNKSTILYSLILLDFLESGVSLLDSDNNNLYSWQHIFIHPKKPEHTMTEVDCRDLYGDVIDLAYIDGMHPMAHLDSVQHSKTTLGEKEKLSAVRQKEGHLLIHWLSKKIKQTYPSLAHYVVLAKPESESKEGHRCCLLDKNNTSYKEIEMLMAAAEKPSNRIKKDPKKLKKWKILHEIIIPFLKERLGTLDCLLTSKTVLKPSNENSCDTHSKSAAPPSKSNSVSGTNEEHNTKSSAIVTVRNQTNSPIQTKKIQLEPQDQEEKLKKDILRLGLDQNFDL